MQHGLVHAAALAAGMLAPDAGRTTATREPCDSCIGAQVQRMSPQHVWHAANTQQRRLDYCHQNSTAQHTARGPALCL